MPDDNVVRKVPQFKVTDWDSEAWKAKAEMVRLSGIGLWDYKRENLENKNKQEVIMEEILKERTGPRVQRCVRTEWNAITGLPNTLIRTPTD
ncbi:hypothetical protein TNCV_35811 [Trichonephila clavipes]|nr:hypothetical protein TNCV_35811 [Trichonephila clavipes]